MEFEAKLLHAIFHFESDFTSNGTWLQHVFNSPGEWEEVLNWLLEYMENGMSESFLTKYEIFLKVFNDKTPYGGYLNQNFPRMSFIENLKSLCNKKSKDMKYILITILSVMLLITTSSSAMGQHWETGELETKSGLFNIENTTGGFVSVKRKTTDFKNELKLGIDPDKGGVAVTINSERPFYNAIYNAFDKAKLFEMAQSDHKLSIRIILDEHGVPFRVNFLLYPNSMIALVELIYIEQEILSNVRYTIRRQQPFGEPCVYFAGATIKFQDILNGEIPGLKRSEQQGKQRPEWER